jgi:hypothetical protein
MAFVVSTFHLARESGLNRVEYGVRAGADGRYHDDANNRDERQHERVFDHRRGLGIFHEAANQGAEAGHHLLLHGWGAGTTPAVSGRQWSTSHAQITGERSIALHANSVLSVVGWFGEGRSYYVFPIRTQVGHHVQDSA